MGKRSSAELEEEEVIVEEVGKKSKKDKKDKKDRKAKDDLEPDVSKIEPVVEEVEQEATETVSAEKKKISEDDFEKNKVLFGKWLKETKEINLADLSAEETTERFKKFVKKYNKQKLSEEYYIEEVKPKWAPAPTTGDVSILLFYAYSPKGLMSRGEQDAAIAFCYKTLNGLGMTGRLRIAREGFNSTLTGTYKTVRQFTDALRVFSPETFGKTDFKYVDNLPENQMLKGLKVWPVTEIVTYGFEAHEAPLNTRGTHLAPVDFHKAMMDPNTVVIDVRNFNETVIGKFAPPVAALDSGATSSSSTTSGGLQGTEVCQGGAKVLDPCMRRSTEFPQWVKDHHDELKDKKVLMYCTAGVRCERASSFLIHQGIEQVYQLDGGIHRYLDAFPEDGGFWVGKNYTFDKRFNHGAAQGVTISQCVYCDKPWDRYQAQRKCGACSMEVVLCKDCQKIKPNIPKHKLVCPLCKAGAKIK